MNNKAYDTQQIDKFFNKIIKNADTITSELNDYLLRYFKNCFNVKAFGNDRWSQSKFNNNTLIDSGELKNSIKIVYKSVNEIHIQSDTPYSSIHNEGGKIRVTEKMKKFFWAKFYETKKDEWKYMALTNKSYLIIPKRQFMGINSEIVNEVEKIILNTIKK